jgi:hypothetical protein
MRLMVALSRTELPEALPDLSRRWPEHVVTSLAGADLGLCRRLVRGAGRDAAGPEIQSHRVPVAAQPFRDRSLSQPLHIKPQDLLAPFGDRPFPIRRHGSQYDQAS